MPSPPAGIKSGFLGVFFAIFATFGPFLTILMQNLKLNTIEVALVGAFVQIILYGIFVNAIDIYIDGR